MDENKHLVIMLNRSAKHLERMMGDVALYIPWHSDRLNQAHRKIKRVRDELVLEDIRMEPAEALSETYE